MIYGTKMIESEVLQEQIIYSGNGFRIGVDGSGRTLRNYGKDPYIKIYKGEETTNHELVSRISLKDTYYVHHNGERNELKLSQRDLKKINDIMKEKPNRVRKASKDGYDTVWDAVKGEIKYICNTKQDPLMDDFDNLQCPDFTKAHEKKKG